MGPRALPPVRPLLRPTVRHGAGGAALAVPTLPPLRAEPVDRTAEAVWCGLIAAALGWDLWLLRGGHRLLSDAARTRAGWCIQQHLRTRR